MLGSRGPNMINKCVMLVLTYKVKNSKVDTTRQHEFYPWHMVLSRWLGYHLSQLEENASCICSIPQRTSQVTIGVLCNLLYKLIST